MERYFQLSNGVRIPAVGFGTWKIPDGRAAEAVENAVKAGYRHIDTAAVYKNEKGVGTGIARCGIARQELFVTSKVWAEDRGYDPARRAFERSLRELDLEYLDLYLIHWPATARRFGDWQWINAATWRAIEEFYDAGKIRAIGVSNFLPHHLEPLMAGAKVMPMVDQIEFHPGFMQTGCFTFCREHGIAVEAWSPLGRGALLEHPALKGIAVKYGKSVAQVCIRWSLQHGAIPLPKSVIPARMAENIEVFDFEIADEEMRAIDALPHAGGSGLDPDKVGF